MKKETAQKLWDDIENYADARDAMGAEGNSGEFSTQSEFETCSRDLTRATSRLISTFANLTGWVPSYSEGTSKENYQDAGWSLTSSRGKTRSELDVLRKTLGEWHTVEIDHRRNNYNDWWNLWQILKDKKPFNSTASDLAVEKRYRHNKKIYHAFWWPHNSCSDGRPNEIAIRENYNWDKKDV